jgi:hypothetical protein
MPVMGKEKAQNAMIANLQQEFEKVHPHAPLSYALCTVPQRAIRTIRARDRSSLRSVGALALALARAQDCAGLRSRRTALSQLAHSTGMGKADLPDAEHYRGGPPPPPPLQ